MPRSSRQPQPDTGLPIAGPFVKWAGGKAQLLTELRKHLPAPGQFASYLEPFVGGGAVLFEVLAHLHPEKASIFDGNGDLVETYQCIRTDVEPLIDALAKHKKQHDEKHYYRVRADLPDSSVARAARFIYLNKTCFNGLYRVNSKNQFNVPIGRYKNPLICDPDNLRAVSMALRKVNVIKADFRQILSWAKPRDFIYLDPPYDPVSSTALFTSYTQRSFGRDDQRDLADVFRVLDGRGCKLMLSNSSTAFIRDLYKGFDIHQVDARRQISSRGDGRGAVKELLIVNYVNAG